MMLTRCPGCATTFRVTPEQVKARHGKVRCGRCQHVFDAIEYLVDAAVVSETPTTAGTFHEEAPAEEQVAALEPAVELPPVAPPEPQEEDGAAVAQVVLEEPPPEESPPAPAEDNILLQPSPLSATYAHSHKALRMPSWPWTVAATLALIVLIIQLLLAFRIDLAVKYPEARPLLEMLCEHAECAVELPSNPEMASIEASDLHPARKGGLELTATLRNRAAYTQAWPHLELTLTDGTDKPIVRKVITPAQYLPATQTEADGFAANGELAVQLLLDAGTLPAAGYRLYLFYP